MSPLYYIGVVRLAYLQGHARGAMRLGSVFKTPLLRIPVAKRVSVSDSDESLTAFATGREKFEDTPGLFIRFMHRARRSLNSPIQFVTFVEVTASRSERKHQQKFAQ